MNKILTVAIPAYNVEEFIEETVKSVADSKYADKIEILIINDGSKDGTAKIGKALEKQFPSVKLINKKNGGHGSTINTGIKQASGKYFKLLDGDDWFDTGELDKLMERLLKTDVDLVLTDLVERYLKTGVSRPVSYYAKVPENTKLDLSKQEFSPWGATLPTTTIKTSLLRNLGLEIDEHCFYVDQEYNLACYISAKTAIYYPLMIYQYRLEREGQSMQKESLIRNVYSHEKVCMRLISEYRAHEAELPEVKKEYLMNRVLIPMCHMQYAIAIDYCKSRKAFLSYDNKLKNYPEICNNPGVAGNITKIHRRTGGLTVPLDGALQWLARLKTSAVRGKLVGLAELPGRLIESKSSYLALGLLSALMMLYEKSLWWLVLLMYVYVFMVKAMQMRREVGLRAAAMPLLKVLIKLAISAVLMTLAIMLVNS